MLMLSACVDSLVYSSPSRGEDPCRLRYCVVRPDASPEESMPGKGKPSEACTDSRSISERVKLMKLGDLRNCLFGFFDRFFFISGRSDSAAPSILSAFEPGCESGELS